VRATITVQPQTWHLIDFAKVFVVVMVEAPEGRAVVG
jgi:hypothetical protein